MVPAVSNDGRRLGLTVGLEGLSLGDQLRVACDGEGWGYTDIWSAETAGADGFSPLAAPAIAASCSACESPFRAW